MRDGARPSPGAPRVRAESRANHVGSSLPDGHSAAPVRSTWAATDGCAATVTSSPPATSAESSGAIGSTWPTAGTVATSTRTP